MSIASWLEKDNIRISKENLENSLLTLQSIEEFRTSKTFEEAYSSIDWFGETCPLKYDEMGNMIGFTGHKDYMDRLPDSDIYSFFSIISKYVDEGSSFSLGSEDEECISLEFRIEEQKLKVMREGVDFDEEAIIEKDVTDEFI